MCVNWQNTNVQCFQVAFKGVISFLFNSYSRVIFGVLPLFLEFLDQGGLCRLLIVALESGEFFFSNTNMM